VTARGWYANGGLTSVIRAWRLAPVSGIAAQISPSVVPSGSEAESSNGASFVKAPAPLSNTRIASRG
jgi:hypothetical protein